MEWTKRRLRLLILIGLVIGFVAIPALAAVFDNKVQVDNGVPLNSSDGTELTLTGSTNISLNNPSNLFPDASTVNITTESGNLSASATGVAELTVHESDITGTYTNITQINASKNKLTIDPEDKAKLSVHGDANFANWTDYAVDDGNTDLVIGNATGGDTNVTFYNLAASTTYSAVDKNNGKPLDVATSDANGNVTLNIPHSTRTVLLQSGDQSNTPTQSNPSPTGDLTQEPSQLSIDISDADFPDDSVDVTIDLNGNQQKSTTITSNSTVTVSLGSLDGGSYTWTVNATDKFGNTNETQYSFNVPSKVYIYNETSPYELLNGTNISIEGVLTGSNETVQIEQNVTNGMIDFSNLPASESYVISLNSESHYPREVYIESIYEQTSVFMLHKNVSAVRNEITIADRTGKFDDNPVVILQKPINTTLVANMTDNGDQWVTIGGDRLGAGGALVIDLQKNGRYRFIVRNVDGDTRVLSEYTAKEGGTIPLEIGQIDYDLGPSGEVYQWTTSIQNESTGGSIQFAYNDPANLTQNLTLTITYRNNSTQLVQQKFTNGPYGEITFTQPISQDDYNNESFIVEWQANRDGEIINANRALGSQQGLEFPIDAKWNNVIYGLITLLLAFVVGVGISPGAGAITVASWSGVAWYIEMVPPELGAGAVIMAFLVAAWTTIQEQDPGVPT